MEQVWEPPVPNFIVKREQYAQEEAELDDIEHDNIQQSPVVDVFRQLVRLEQVKSDFSHHVHDVDYLLSLATEFHVCLLGKLMSV